MLIAGTIHPHVGDRHGLVLHTETQIGQQHVEIAFEDRQAVLRAGGGIAQLLTAERRIGGGDIGAGATEIVQRFAYKQAGL